MPRRSGDAALIAAMGVCGSGEADEIAAELMERDSTRASMALIGAVVRAWRVLSEPAREAAVLCAGDRLDGVLDGLVGAGDPTSRRLAAAIDAWRVERGTAHPEVIRRLERLGTSGASGIGDVARGALRALTIRPVPLGDAEHAALDSALAAVSAAALEHGDSGFMALMAHAAIEPGPRLARWLDARGEAGHGMVRAGARRVLAQERDPVAVACTWLRYAALARPAAALLEETFLSGRGDAVVSRVDLIADESSRSALRRWCRAEKLAPTREMLGAWPVEARVRVPHWLDVIGLREDRRNEMLEGMLLDSAASVRLSAVMALSRMKASPRVDDVLLRAARDEDERVAIAAIEVLGGAQSARRRAVIAPLLEELGGKGGALVRQTALDVLARFARDEGAPEVRVRAHLGGVRR